MSDADLDKHLPLTPAVFHILLSLAGGERHGYGVMKEVASQTGDELRLGPGKLYYSIQRLLERDLIEEVEAVDALDDPRRRTYRITALGRRVVRAEAERLERAVGLARRRELLGPSEETTR